MDYKKLNNEVLEEIVKLRVDVRLINKFLSKNFKQIKVIKTMFLTVNFYILL